MIDIGFEQSERMQNEIDRHRRPVPPSKDIAPSRYSENRVAPSQNTYISSGLSVHRESDVFFHIHKPKTVHWSVAWSDLMMTMFIMFAVLYMYQAAHREFIFGKEPSVSDMHQARFEEAGKGKIPRGKIPQSVLDTDSEIIDQSQAILQAEDPEALARIDLVKDKAVRIILPGDLLFDTGQAELKPAARRALSKVAAYIRKSDYMVNVVGHTDNIPMASSKFPTNWELSAIRACTVVRFLTEKMGLPEKRFYVSGYSYHQPLRPNDSLRNRAINRRVEVILTKERPYATIHTYQDIYDFNDLK